ncbi:hypothetical protein N7468_006956 [Penicillium chermesinum]|uniref:AB hydrolase-1 domain-containing protein n=1 Tax=Penicillium chermesinum TaxID=63820 RepID=A0A9W9NTX0_9EURO|nr:uncharacterized protein N7468_006956 [Penicillium chermesinum]KAJ5225731.1 hypothetical protein N7468_006956 [Penicillium chermesinum]
MSSFNIAEHVIDGQYVREYHHATTTPDAPLKLCIKQYSPKNNPEPQPGDATLIAAHGTGFPKELYEPLWEELLARLNQAGTRVRSIWIADAANQNASGILNENNLGSDRKLPIGILLPPLHRQCQPSRLANTPPASSFDHSRDLLHMINHFREQMPRPLIGVGHSLGAVQMIFTSLIHPRLFTSLILLEPYIIEQLLSGDGSAVLAMSAKRRDVFRSRAEATEQYRKVLKAWDPRVFDLWARYGYRDLPTAIHPTVPKAIAHSTDPADVPVTLATTKHQETLMYARLNLNRHVELGVPAGQTHLGQQVCRSEHLLSSKLVPFLRPTVLYVSGAGSPLCKAGVHARAAKRTGTQWGGSGGVEYERVEHVLVPKAGHTLPLEKVADTAAVMGPWIAKEVERFGADEQRLQEGWEKLSLKEKRLLGRFGGRSLTIFPG